MEQADLLISRMEDLSKTAMKTGSAASRFLTPTQAHVVSNYFKHKGVSLSFEGGFDDAERVRAVFLNPEWGKYDNAALFSALVFEFRPQDTLGHRDILGSLMALGIERDTVGDIVVVDNTATIVCLPELSRYIMENLIKAGRVGITAKEISVDELPSRQEEMRIKTDTVASQRLDAILSAAFRLSRAKASELITAGNASLDYQVCMQPTKEVSEGSLISVRGLGRAKVLEIGGTSRKGRMFVRLGLYKR